MDFGITDWIVENFQAMLAWLKSIIIDVINMCIEALCTAIDFATSFLPNITMPTFQQLTNDNQLLTFLNWIVPVDVLVLVLGIWLLSDLAYIVVAPVLRWLKLIAR